MYSKLQPFSFMGVSNPEVFLSEKDLSSNTMEFSFLVRPPLEFQGDRCQIAPFEDVVNDEPQRKEKSVQEQDQQQKKEEEEEEEEEDKCRLVASPVELKLPSLGEFKVQKNGEVEEEEEIRDGFKTPTSLDNKIPVQLKCPPAPRKPKTLASPKRKAFRRRILLDLTKEIESLFPPALLADLGNKIKKVRQGSDFK